MKLITRKEWGAKLETGSTPLRQSAVEGIAIHYSAAFGDEPEDHSTCAAVVRGIQSYHMSEAVDGGKGPWWDIAYSFLVCRHGYVFEGRGWEKRTAAQGARDGNDHYLAACFLGSDRAGRDDVTSKGRQAYSELINVAQSSVFHKQLDVKPHSFFDATECPGDELRAYVHLRGWEHEKPSDGLPSPLPNWLWKWERWRLDNRAGNGSPRPQGVPRVIPPWAWLWAKNFELRRNQPGPQPIEHGIEGR